MCVRSFDRRQGEIVVVDVPREVRFRVFVQGHEYFGFAGFDGSVHARVVVGFVGDALPAGVPGQFYIQVRLLRVLPLLCKIRVPLQVIFLQVPILDVFPLAIPVPLQIISERAYCFFHLQIDD